MSTRRPIGLRHVLAERNERVLAARQFRLFLQYALRSPEAAQVRARLAELEKPAQQKAVP